MSIKDFRLMEFVTKTSNTLLCIYDYVDIH